MNYLVEGEIRRFLPQRKPKSGPSGKDRFVRTVMGKLPIPPSLDRARTRKHQDERSVHTLASLYQHHDDQGPVITIKNQDKAYDHFLHHGEEGVAAEVRRLRNIRSEEFQGRVSLAEGHVMNADELIARVLEASKRREPSKREPAKPNLDDWDGVDFGPYTRYGPEGKYPPRRPEPPPLEKPQLVPTSDPHRYKISYGGIVGKGAWEKLGNDVTKRNKEWHGDKEES